MRMRMTIIKNLTECPIRGPKCLGLYEIGLNGTSKGCDACQGLQRGNQGYFWLPDERYHSLQIKLKER
jgi:hypothetical protein